jgi:hypothetical protein
MRVALVAQGPTAAGYLQLALQDGSRHEKFDQTWIVNKFTGLIESDLVFHMDDFRVQEARAAAGNTAVAKMLDEMKRTKTTIITSRAYDEYPTAKAFPLGAVINDLGFPYFNGTIAYAIAYAIHTKVKELSLFGCDFAWANSPAKVERGRGCCEYWLGRAHGRGMVVRVLELSTLLDGGKPQLYGYDTQRVKMEREPDGSTRVSFEDVPMPSPEEMEKRYDHTDFTNLRRVG